MDKRRKQKVCMLIALIIGVLLTGYLVHQEQVKQKRVQATLAKEVFRFHVLANSDTKEDQELKLRVKDCVVSYLKGQISKESTVEDTKKWTKKNISKITEVAQREVEDLGYDYSVKASVGKSRFPEKSYGDITFPPGVYEALRIEIGEGKGRNWWCVLYPNLCFMDSVRAIVPEEGKAQLKEVLTEEEYHEITEMKIKWFYLQICEGVCRITDVVR